MLKSDNYKNKSITVLGIARSGLACANLLLDFGAKVFVSDIKDNEITRLAVSKLISEDIKFELGKHTREFIEGKDLIIVSPGIPDDALPLIWARQLNIPVISEIEFAWTLCPAEVIAVTGSNGKTTVTTLIGNMLDKAGKTVFVCGNIGRPFSAEVYKMKQGDFVSLEISSFQLEKIKTFKPKIAVMLNFSRNHLDRHKDMQEYLDAKQRIFMNQDETDYLVLNAQDQILKGLAKKAKSKAVFFNQNQGLNPNHSAVLAVGKILGIDEELTRSVFAEFKGVEHRMEDVAEIKGVRFINDSKATTAESTIWAFTNIASPIILIAGGKHKGIDYKVILDIARKKVKKAVLIGQAKSMIKEALSGEVPFEEAESLEDAVSKAFFNASAGDCILLSPMCSSYDMFSDYEDRGRVFKKLVFELVAKINLK